MTTRRERNWGRPGWWVFDAPRWSDPVWWACLATAVVGGAWGAWREVVEANGVATHPETVFVSAALQVWLAAAVALGSVRAYRRARVGTA